MKKITMVLICLLVAFQLSAQTAWNRAIGSEDGLKSYCLERSTRAYIGVWGGDDIVAISNANQYVYVYSSDPLKLAEKVSTQKLGFGIVVGSTETIQKSCCFYDENYRLMYYGYAEGKIIKAGDISSLVWKDIKMTVPDSLRMSLPKEYNGGYVYLKYTDENGNTRYIYLGQGKEFDWLKSFAGLKDARLLVRGYTEDGYALNQVVDVASGEFMPIEEMVEDFNSITMEGFSYHTNSLTYVVGSTNSIGKSPLFQFTSATNSYGLLKTVGISVKTSEGEKPLGFYYRKVDGTGAWPDWQYVELSGLDVEGFRFPVGIYHVDFKWPRLHSEDWKQFQNYNNNDGGKGG